MTSRWSLYETALVVFFTAALLAMIVGGMDLNIVGHVSALPTTFP